MYNRKKRVILKNRIIMFLVIIFCLIFSGILINKKFNLPNSFIKDSILYIDRIIVSLFQNHDSSEAESEVTDLSKKLEELENYKIENIELNLEIQKLKEVLNLNTLLSDKEYVNATVINRNLNYWFQSLVIDRGLNDNITNDMAVISNGGLVGITSNVGSNSSNVSLLCNSVFPVNISIKIIVDDKELFGILNNYSDGFYEIMGIVENVDILSDSIVVTTGLGNIFPSGLLVGYVDSVITDNFDLSKIVKVRPSVDFNNISYVTVVKREEK